jgi:hypothetical protein
MAMDVVQLWAHIKREYNGKLYEPEVVQVSEEELKAREREMNRKLVRQPTVVVHTPVTIQRTYKISEVDEAETDIFGKSCVKKVFRLADNQLVVIMEDNAKMKKLRWYCTKHYKDVKITIIGEDE